MTGVLPPSSIVWCAKWRAASAPEIRPASVPPVSTNLSMPGCSASALPVVAPRPVTTLNTPAGSPASTKICASLKVVSGVYSEHLTTVVHPEANTGARLFAMIISGWLNGVQLPTTPIGERWV